MGGGIWNFGEPVQLSVAPLTPAFGSGVRCLLGKCEYHTERIAFVFRLVRYLRVYNACNIRRVFTV